MELSVDLFLNATLAAVIGTASFFDIRERRIPNRIIICALGAAAVLGACQGFDSFLAAFAGFGIGVAALLCPFAFGWMGAGDVKLFAAIGALVGYAVLPRVFFYSCIAAGVIALCSLAIEYAKIFSSGGFWIDCKLALLTRGRLFRTSLPMSPGTRSVPWGVAMGAGTIMAYYVDGAGKWAGF